MKPEHPDEEYEAKMAEAFKRDRFNGWPAIISIAGFLAVTLRMIFGEIDGYIIVGEIDIYFWELGLFFLVGLVSFVPIMILEAKRVVAGLPQIPTGIYWKKVGIYFLISFVVAFLIRVLVYRSFF